MSQIGISPARTLGAIDPKLFGGFVEHLGRCIYGGLYDEGSPLSDERGFRKDVLALLRDLRLGGKAPRGWPRHGGADHRRPEHGPLRPAVRPRLAP